MKTNLQEKQIKAASQQMAPPVVKDALNTTGAPLDKTTQGFMESKFGKDFSQVKVHTDATAAQSASMLDASAYTVGSDIVFNKNQYDPANTEGKKLLAHELTHVSQQSTAKPNIDGLRVAQPGGSLEKEADNSADDAVNGVQPAAATQVNSPVVQRSFLGVLKDIALFVPRLFGAELYSKEELQEYIQSLKDAKGPAKTLFSDNKARACVSREQELGGFDTDIKVWLVEDMLHGWTTFLDEDAIIKLIRRSNDRADIVKRVGRDRLWDNFSGKNRRIIEALTLTAADAGDAMVAKFRNKPINEIKDYIANAIDPAVKESLRQAAALANITAPVPASATIAQDNKAQININGVDVTFEPDGLDPSLGKHAMTYSQFSWDTLDPFTINPGQENDPVGDIQPLKVRVRIFTNYPSEESKSGTSKYGVGTRPGDENTLRFHERGHGEAWIRFLRENPPPVFGAQKGSTLTQFNAAIPAYQRALEAYREKGTLFALREADCVGTLPTDEDYAGTGYTAAICHNP